ncbi:MAG: shikimate kinase [Candidatus Omnitrophica bacterium]|nr:shikimate kinase [Candidatus Omnitrophota bacterium]
MKTNIVLTGFMGAGKSLVAQTLSAHLDRLVFSTDELIIKREGRPITEIFADSGEDYFRKVEREVVEEVSQKENIIIDCGGGVVVNPENAANLKKGGTVFYLKASPQVIYDRIKTQAHRPLVNVEDPMAKIQELLSFREEFYVKADHVIITDILSIEQVCEEVVTLLNFKQARGEGKG